MTTIYSIQGDGRVVRPRISDVLFQRMERRFDSLASLASNCEAIDAGVRFVVGDCPFVVIVGPSGWGKTHLLESVAAKLAQDGFPHSRVVAAADWLDGRAPVDARNHLLLDDVQDVLNRTRSRYRFRLEMERRVRVGMPTMLAITADIPSRRAISFLPNHRDWNLFEMDEPASRDKEKVVSRIAKSEGVALSDQLCRIIGTRMKGNGNTFHGSIVKLKSVQHRWQTDEDVVRACGLLNLFFADNPEWDLREKILAAAKSSATMFVGIDACGLACYAMKEVAHLAENDVARYCGISHAKVHENSVRFQDRLSVDPVVQESFRTYMASVVKSLS